MMNSGPTPSADEKILEWEAGERTLVGVQALTRSTVVCEMAGQIGVDAVWIEVEHGAVGFEAIEAMSVASIAGGAVPVARVPDHHRHHVLRSLEVGARIVVVPMVNDAAIAQEIVRWGKFDPLGERGFNTGSRGLRYGLHDVAVSHEWANAHTHLIAQIETREAMENLDAILAVAGISGVLVGPGDLSCSLGVPRQREHELVQDAVRTIVRRTKGTGKKAGILASPPLLKIAMEEGADLLFCSSDVNVVAQGWRNMLAQARDGFRNA